MKVLSLLFLTLPTILSAEMHLDHPEQGRMIVRYARSVLVEKLTGKKALRPEINLPPAGLFVTLVKNRAVRGCYGSLSPEGQDLFDQIRDYTIGAATQDFRKTPIHPSELQDLVIILSFPKSLEPVSNVYEVDPKQQGLLVRSGSRAAILLPGEARTARWQLEEARRQAGIGSKENVELFRIHTWTIYER